MLETRFSPGLDGLLDMVEGRAARPPILDTLNARPTEAARGAVALHAAPDGRFAGTDGVVQAGWYGAVLEAALHAAVATMLEPSQVARTLDYRVTVVRALPAGTEAEIRAQVQHAGDGTAAAAAELRGFADNRLYAAGAITCLIAGRITGG